MENVDQCDIQEKHGVWGRRPQKILKYFDVKNEFAIQKVVKTESETKKEIGDIKTESGEMKKDISEMKTENGETKKEVKRNTKITISLLNGWKVTAALMDGWKYYGRGRRGSYDERIHKQPTTFPQCLQMCQKQRIKYGELWNGMGWRDTDGWCSCYKNDKGHDDTSWLTYMAWLHFKTY